MIKPRLAPFAVFGLCAAIAIAQENASVPDAPAPIQPTVDSVAHAPTSPAEESTTAPAKRKPKVAATPLPAAATPAPKKLGFWARVFGQKQPTPKPVPAATPVKVVVKPKATTPTPKPTVSVKPKATPSPDKVTSNPPPEKSVPVKTVAEKPSPKVEGQPVAVEKKATPSPKKPVKDSKITTGKHTGGPAPDGSDPEALEKWKYNEAKGKAMDDAKVQDLKSQADSAASEEDARKALRAYNKALFGRMREIDPSVKDRINLMESAVLRRLGE